MKVSQHRNEMIHLCIKYSRCRFGSWLTFAFFYDIHLKKKKKSVEVNPSPQTHTCGKKKINKNVITYEVPHVSVNLRN